MALLPLVFHSIEFALRWLRPTPYREPFKARILENICDILENDALRLALMEKQEFAS
jgi:hypothetical protein